MDSLFTFVMAVVALMVVPGPDMAYCIASGLSYGKRGAWFAALGVGLGGVVLAIATAVLVWVAHGVDSRLLLVIQLGGCLYLLYLSVKIIAPRHTDGDDTIAPIETTPVQMLTRGVVTNLSNPKALVFFLSFIPQFIATDAESPALHALGLGLLLCVIGTVMNVGFGLAGTTAKSLNQVVFLHRSLAQIVLALVFFVIALVFLVDIARSV